MKNLIFSFAFIAFILSSCGNEAENKSNSDGKSTMDKETIDEPKDCDTFLDEFEYWAEEYIATLKVFRTDPANPKLAKRYNYQTRELMTWQREWEDMKDCTTNENYLNRYTTISGKVNREQKRLAGY